MKKKKLKTIILIGYVIPSMSPQYCLGGLQTFLMLLSFPSTCMQVLQWLCLPPTTPNVFHLDPFIYSPLSYPLYFLPITYCNAFQHAGGDLMVYYPLISTTMDWLLPFYGSQQLKALETTQELAPLLSILEEMQKY